ncbi:hypothetical protein BG004_008137, partial [Podila humilis]
MTDSGTTSTTGRSVEVGTWMQRSSSLTADAAEVMEEDMIESNSCEVVCLTEDDADEDEDKEEEDEKEEEEEDDDEE